MVILIKLNFIVAGLEAELYYVREGVVNAYAMTFVVPVPANIADLEFSWQSLAGVPVSKFIINVY